MGPLAAYRIIEMAGIGPAPFAAMLLSDMGAEVIRVDRRGEADLGLPGRRDVKFDVLHRGRRSIAVDVKAQAGREVVKRLAKAPPASEVTNEVIAAAVVDGYGPKLPRGRRWLAFLNKASDDRLKAAEKLGETLLRRGAPEVVFGEAIRPHECFYRMTAGSGSEASSE